MITWFIGDKGDVQDWDQDKEADGITEEKRSLVNVWRQHVRRSPNSINEYRPTDQLAFGICITNTLNV